MDRDKLNRILKEHSIWLNSAGTRGTRADLTRAILTDADLTRAYLTGANLTGVNLTGTILPYPIYQVYFGQYYVYTEKEHIRIGCKYMTIQEWLEVDIDRAVQMGLDSKHYRNYMAFIKWYANEYRHNKEFHK